MTISPTPATAGIASSVGSGVAKSLGTMFAGLDPLHLIPAWSLWALGAIIVLYLVYFIWHNFYR